MNLDKQYGCFKSVHFSNNLVVCSSSGPKTLAFGSHCSANFQPILDCFISNFMYEDSKTVKADRVNTVVFNSHKNKRRAFLGASGRNEYSRLPAKLFH